MPGLKRMIFLFLSVAASLILILSQSFAVSAAAWTRQESLGGQAGDPLRVDVYDNGSLGLFFLQHDDPADPDSPASFVSQYYADTAWGSCLFLTDGSANCRFSSDYAAYYDEFSPEGTICETFSPGEMTRAGQTVSTAWTLYDGDLQLVQTIACNPGSHACEKTFTVTNLSARTFTALKFIHGGDTFFGGSDCSRSYWNDLTRTVYLKNVNTTGFGLMSFSGSLATPPDRYFAGDSRAGNLYAAAGELPNTVDEAYLDAGYQLQWNKTELAAGESWTIAACEQVTEPGDVQILAPAGQNAARGGVASYDFVVQNFSAAEAVFNLAVQSGQDWPVQIQGDAAIALAGGASRIVRVIAAIPADAGIGADDILTLTAVQADNPDLIAAGSTRTLVDENIPSIVSVTASADQFFTSAGSLAVSVITRSVAAGSEVEVTLLDAGKNPLDPRVSGIASLAADEDMTGTAAITLDWPGELAPGIYYLAVAIGSAQLLEDSVSVEALADFPVTGEHDPWLPLAGGLALIALACWALAIRRRISRGGPAG